MIQLSNLGHNNPPSDAELLKQRLETQYDLEIDQVKSLLAREIPKEITNDIEQQKLADFIAAVDACDKEISEIHKREKGPYKACADVVDAFKRTKVDALAAIKTKALAVMDVFLAKKDAEERERLRQIAERERLEALEIAKQAEAHAAADIPETAAELHQIAEDQALKADNIEHYADTAKSSKLVRARAQGGGSVTRRKFWQGEIVDPAKVALEPLRKYIDLQKAVDAFVKDGGRELAGVVIEEKTESKFRGSR